MLTILDDLFEAFVEIVEEKIYNDEEYIASENQMHEMYDYLSENSTLSKQEVIHVLESVDNIYRDWAENFVTMNLKYFFLNGIDIGLNIDKERDPKIAKMISQYYHKEEEM
ncbi:MAG: hypothetical protein ACLUVC_15930 [Longibaculum sp.]